MSLPRALLLASASLALPSLAAPIQTNYGTGDGSMPGGAMPTNNLLSTNLLSATRTGAGDAYFYREDSGYTVDLGRLYDGQFGTPGGNQAYTVMPNAVSLTFNLNLATRPGGYDIASIRTYAGWDDGRDGQAYTVQYSTAANPGQFTTLATVSRFDNADFPQIPNPMYGMYNHMADYFLQQYSWAMMNNDPMAQFFWDMYTYEMSNNYMNGPMYYSDTGQSSTMVQLTDVSGVLASGVASLRFNFSGVENSGTAFREFIVEGIAPTTVTSVVSDLGSFNIAGLTTFEGGGFAPTTSEILPEVLVAAGFTGTLDAAGGNITGTEAVTINGTSLTLTGSATSVISLSGGISGAGILINAGGNNVLSGANTCAGISVTGGSLRVTSAASLPSANNSVASGGTMILPSDVIFAGALTIAGAGATGQPGALVLDGSGAANFGQTGLAVTLSGHATIALLGNQDYVVNGVIDAATPGKTLTLDTGNARMFPDGGIGANIAEIVKEGSGTLHLRSAVAGALVVNAGTCSVGFAGASGSGVTVNAGASLRLGSDMGTPISYSVPLTLAGNTALSFNSAASVTQAGQVSLTADTTITSTSAENVIAGSIGGATPGQNLTLQVTDHTLKLTGTTAATVAQVTKAGAGTLLVDATGVIHSAGVVVSGGLLTNNGIINGTVSVAANGVLGGSGILNGAVTVAGVLAPGNSPGVQTQATGDTTLSTGARFLAQLGGTSPGNGDGFHDQYFVQNGSFIIGPNATLDVRSWVKADGLTTFVPVRGDRFAVIRASNGIVGQFADLTNPDYGQWILYANVANPTGHHGYLYGTGLAGNQTFAAYADSAARAAIGASLWAAAITPAASSTPANPGGFLDGNTALGQVAIGLLTAGDTAAFLDALSPEAYLAVGDYALTTTRALTDAAFAQGSLLRTGSWSLGAGYNRAERTYVDASPALSHRLTSDSPFVTAAFDFGPHCSVGFFYGQNHGKTAAAAAQIDYRGGVFGLTSVGRIPGAYPVTLKGAVVASDLRFDATRAGAVGGASSAASRQKLRSLGGQLTASVELYKDGRLSFSPTLGFVHGRSTTDALTESGPGANLALDALEQDSSRLVAGFGLTYLANSQLAFDLTAAYEREYASAVGSATATFAGAASALPMTTVRAIDDRDTATAGLGVSWQFDPRATLRLGTEVRGNREIRKDHRYTAAVNVRF